VFEAQSRFLRRLADDLADLAPRKRSALPEKDLGWQVADI